MGSNPFGTVSLWLWPPVRQERYDISPNMAAGQIGPAAHVSRLFAVIVAMYGIVLVRNLLDLARGKYVVEARVFAAQR